jgi:ribonuclease Y
MELSQWLLVFSGVVLAFLLGIVYLIIKKNLVSKRVEIAEQTAERILQDAKRESETLRKEAKLESKELLVKYRTEAEQEIKGRKIELSSLEKRLLQREEHLDKKEKNIEGMEKKVKEKDETVEKNKKEIEDLKIKYIKELEKVSQLPVNEAKKLLLQNLEREIEKEAAQIIKKKEDEIRRDSERKAREILSTVIQRCAVDHVTETTTSLVELPTDEMKGRIIGREGRNIKAFETLSGVDLIVDDTPEAVILSSFDPYRREVARITLQKLIADGRIHPARVEEMYKKAKEEVKRAMWEYGENACLKTGVHNIPRVLVQLLGRLHYRTSYGQNVLQHSIEMAYLAGMLAQELGVNAKLAKRAALLHDIGKAIDHEVEGTHVKLGVMFAQKAGESAEILHAIEAHHGDVDAKTIEAVLVAIADAISSARPGARRDTLEAYVKRLERLEAVAKSFDGVEKCYAIQAGREIRVMVEPNKIDDLKATKLSHDIARKIESELEYPGEVRVTIIRETRATDIAK